MKYQNQTSKTILIRKGESTNCEWIYVKPNEIIDLENFKLAENAGLTEVKTKTGTSNNKKIETKVIKRKTSKKKTK